MGAEHMYKQHLEQHGQTSQKTSAISVEALEPDGAISSTMYGIIRLPDDQATTALHHTAAMLNNIPSCTLPHNVNNTQLKHQRCQTPLLAWHNLAKPTLPKADAHAESPCSAKNW